VCHEKELVGMGDLVEPANLGVEVTTQQEVGGHVGGMRKLVRQSKKSSERKRNDVKIKSSSVFDVNSISSNKISKLFCKFPSQIAHKP